MRHFSWRIIGLITLVCFTTLAAAPGWAVEKRLALVVGIGAYAHLPGLGNSVADARLVADKLRGDGFDVDFASDPTRDGLNKTVRDFGRRIAEAGGDTVALFYYAGHGVQDEAQVNYLIGADADVKSQVDLPLEAMRLDNVLGTIEAARPRISFAVIDACRDNPLPASTHRGSSRGLAVEAERRGLLIAFSTEPGKTADDGPAGQNSPFAAAFAHELEVPALEAATLFRDVSRRVLESTNQEQFPWITQRLTEDFYFRPGTPPQPTADMADKPLRPSAAQPAAAPPIAATPNVALALSAADGGEIDYGRAVVTNTVQGYVEWLAHHNEPDHPRRKSVMALLQRLNEQRLWDGARSASSTAVKRDALERLRVAFPDGVYADKAKAELDKMNDLDAPVVASVTPEQPLQPSAADVPSPRRGFYYVTGLDTAAGYGWLALRFHPSFDSRWSDTHLGEGTLLTVIGRSGEWLNVRLQSGETGWANARYVACCTTDTETAAKEASQPRAQIASVQPDAPARSAGGLYYVKQMDGSGVGWLALRRGPSFKSTWSDTHLFPGTTLNVFGRSDPWLHVRLQDGEVGWVNEGYVACCR